MTGIFTLLQSNMSAIEQTTSVNVNYQQLIHNYLLEKFNISKEGFNPEVLKNGTEEEKQLQLQLWAKGPSSIYIRWIPDELSTPEAATTFFSNFGKVSRADIVPKTDASKKCYGNMAFIHFESWDNPIFPQTFVSSYPQPVDVNFNTRTRYGTLKTYTLKTCVNVRPVAQVEFNGPQMMDMMNNLETRMKNELEAMRNELEGMKKEKQQIHSKLLECREMAHQQKVFIEKHIVDESNQSGQLLNSINVMINDTC